MYVCMCVYICVYIYIHTYTVCRRVLYRSNLHKSYSVCSHVKYNFIYHCNAGVTIYTSVILSAVDIIYINNFYNVENVRRTSYTIQTLSPFIVCSNRNTI